MLKVKKIGDIELDYPLFIKEEFIPKNVKAVSFNTLGGSRIVYESVKRLSANYITLISKDSGWVKEETLKKILTLADDVGVETTVTFTDDTSVDVRFAYENGDVIKTEDAVHENGGWFTVEISLCRI